MTPPDVFHVGMENAIRKGADELDVIDPLVAEMTGVVVEAERLVASEGFKGTLSRGNVKGDLRRVHFQSELHTLSLEGVEDASPAPREVLVACLYRLW